MNDAFSAGGGPGAAFLILFFCLGIGAITAYVLYRVAHLKPRVGGVLPDGLEPKASDTSVPSTIRQKLEKISPDLPRSEAAVKAISKIVAEETEQKVRDIQAEYSAKFQAAIQEKNKEVEMVRKDYSVIKEKYGEVEDLYKKANTEKRQTEAVVQSIAEGLVVVNQKGEVLLMNPSAERLLGVEKEKKIGKPIGDGLRDEILVSLARDSGASAEKVIEFKGTNENVKKIIRSSSAVIQNENGQTVGMVNILTDVTKQKELEEAKNKFVSNVTHELRTPIVAMQKAIEILQDPSSGNLSEVQTNFMNIVSRNLTHLGRLVEDVLDIAKIDSGRMQIRSAPTELNQVIQETCDTLATWARSKNIRIICNLEENLPEISMDKLKITQVLNNLISNAIKFTPAGGVITVSSSRRPDNPKAEIRVSDTGVGIAQENIPKLFQRFEQFGDQQGISGTGLGLSIAKEIVEKHGGGISVQSVEKKGTTFTFTLPLQPKRISGDLSHPTPAR